MLGGDRDAGLEGLAEAIVEASPNPVAVVQDGVIVFANPAAVRMLGHERREELVGLPATAVVHPSGLGLARQRIERTGQGFVNAPVEVLLLRRDGSTVEAESTSAPIAYRGRPATLVVGHDISARKRVERTLRESQRHSMELYSLMRLMCDNVPDLIWAKDLNGAYTFVNRAMAEKVLGTRDTAEALGKTDLYFARRARAAHPEDRDRHTYGEICQSSDEVVLRTRRAQRFDEPGRALGHPLVLDVYKAPFFDEHGELVGTVGCARDVTHEREVEQEHRWADEAYRTLVQLSPYGLVLLQAGRPVFVNPAVCALTGYDSDELLAMSREEIAALVHPEHRELAFRRLDELMRGEPVPPELEFQLLTRGGEPRWVRTTMVLSDHRGVPSAHVVVVDITERKAAAQRLQASLAEKEVLLRELHHRVKNNLHAIMALVELQADTHDEATARTLKDLEGRIASMALVHESLYQAEDLATIAFQEYLDRLTNRLIHVLGGRAEVDVHLTAPPLALPFDAAIPCGLVVNELVTNAFKHAFPDGRPGPHAAGATCSIEVVLAVEDGEITLEVRDNGVGLAPGFDWHATETLGLRVVNMLATQHLGGSVRHSGDGGARFSVRFPDPRPATAR